MLLLAFAAIWRPDATPSRGAGDRVATQAPTGATRLLQAELEATPPAYTQLAPIRSSTLDAKLPQGSVLRWRLRFEPAPRAAALQFHDGTRVALVADGDAWRGEYTLDVSALYRIVLDGVPAPIDDRLYRLDAIADRAPEVRLLVPDKTLSQLQPGQKSWDLAYEASDDYGIAQATLTVTHAQGSGENIAFKEQVIVLDGTPPESSLTPVPPSPAVRERDERGPRVVLRYSHAIDLAALGFSMGDDVVVRLAVTDNREPGPNTTRSASTILRWPAAPSQETAGLDGIVQKTMPAYFRSQRQIIIDTEALIAEKAQLDEAKLLARSDSIGVDQKLLRLRYGQFLGEESEGHGLRQPARLRGKQACEAVLHRRLDARCAVADPGARREARARPARLLHRQQPARRCGEDARTVRSAGIPCEESIGARLHGPVRLARAGLCVVRRGRRSGGRGRIALAAVAELLRLRMRRVRNRFPLRALRTVRARAARNRSACRRRRCRAPRPAAASRVPARSGAVATSTTRPYRPMTSTRVAIPAGATDTSDGPGVRPCG